MQNSGKIGRAVDRLSDITGRCVSWLGVILILELVYDTTARYIFNAPTTWSYDVSYMLYGTLFMIGASYTLMKNDHVRIGVIYDRKSPRSRSIIDLAGYIIFFFPVNIALLVYGVDFAMTSFNLREHAGVSMWSPPIYPFKAVIPIAALLLLLQGSVETFRCIERIKGGRR